jgi:hypothetical protein
VNPRRELLLLAALAVASCAIGVGPPDAKPAVAPTPVACPASPPEIGAACKPPPDDFCSWPAPSGERVCHCEADRWSCFDKPAAQPPG